MCLFFWENWENEQFRRVFIHYILLFFNTQSFNTQFFFSYVRAIWTIEFSCLFSKLKIPQFYWHESTCSVEWEIIKTKRSKMLKYEATNINELSLSEGDRFEEFSRQVRLLERTLFLNASHTMHAQPGLSLRKGCPRESRPLIYSPRVRSFQIRPNLGNSQRRIDRRSMHQNAGISFNKGISKNEARRTFSCHAFSVICFQPDTISSYSTFRISLIFLTPKYSINNFVHLN